jgi:4-hydroxybenzoate polyprenyltransferase
MAPAFQTNDQTELNQPPNTAWGYLRLLVKSMRPRQWIKNAVLFAALVFDRQFNPAHWREILHTSIGFAIFCVLSGLVYIINDISDVESDRKHPDKRKRPIASGKLPIPVARVFATASLVVLLPIAYVLSPAFALVALAYFLLNLIYSKWIKHIPLLDVLAIALGFVLRVVAGVVLIHVARFSPWLYVVVTLGSLYIGFGKRRSELAIMAENATNHRKVLDGYTIPLLDQFITIVSACTIIAYSLYTFSAPNLPNNHVMMLTIPFVIYGIFRYLYLVQIKHSGGAPEEVLLSDKPLLTTILLWGFAIMLIFYVY